MFAVIFEVNPYADQWDAYLGQAAKLRPELEKIDGFIDNERYRSREDESQLLSLSRWRDEKALVRWRTLPIHHGSQESGRGGIFRDYHLRVGEYAGPEAERTDETGISPSKAASITEIPHGEKLTPPSGPDVLSSVWFASLNDPPRDLLLVSWISVEAASAWKPAEQTVSHGVVRIVRDYGMRDRREAPQFHPPVMEGKSA